MKINFNINIKTLCLYERLTGKSALSVESEEDIFYMLYCIFVMSNHERIDFPAFCSLIENPKLLKELINQYEAYMKFNQQFNHQFQKEQPKEDNKDTKEIPKITDLVGFCVSVIGIDPEYTMEKMELWELDNYISTYLKHKEGEDKERLIENRLWTFLTMSPHITSRR